MKTIWAQTVLAAAIAAFNCAAAPADASFIDVNLAPMDTERTLRHQTVVIHDHTIVAMGRVKSTPVPVGCN